MSKKRAKNSIVASALTEANILATWDANFTVEDGIAAENPPVPNPAASPDSPGGAAGKQRPTTGPNDSPNGSMQPGKDGKPPIPRFNMMAYGGGPMRVSGWNFPVLLVNPKPVAAHVPIYCGHITPWTPEKEKMEQLLGQSDQFDTDPGSGAINCCGPLTGSSPTVKLALSHAKAGFKWQASIDSPPPAKEQVEFLKTGEIRSVNGRVVAGPMCLIHGATICNIAVVPLGADISTSTNIAASAAKGIVMEFVAWLKATYHMDAAALNAEQEKAFKAEFARISAAAVPGSGTPSAANTNGGAAAPAPVQTATIAAQGPRLDENRDAGHAAIQAGLATQNAAYAANLERISKIQEIAKDFPAVAAQAIRENWAIDRVTDKVETARMQADRAPAAVHAAYEIPKEGLGMKARSVDRGGRESGNAARVNDQMAAVVETCGMISAGYSAERIAKNPAYGERLVDVAESTMKKFGRGLGPMGLMRLAAHFAGVMLPHNPEEAYRSVLAEFSTLNLPIIFSNIMNKFLIDSFTAVDPDRAGPPGDMAVAWQKFTRRGPVNDFKPQYRVRIASNMELQPLGDAGEIKTGQVSEQSYLIQAVTKAIMFAITRVQIINDDLSAMQTLPTQFGRGAGIAVAKLIYGLLIAALQSDRATAFFASAAITTAGNLMQPNLLTGTGGLSFVSLEAAESAFNLQTDPYGQPAGATAEILLVPPAIANLAKQLYQSENLIPSLGAGGNLRGAPGKNTLAGKYRPVSSNWLTSLTAAQINAVIGGNVTTTNAGDATTFYLLAGPQSPACAIEAGFLNGSEMPIVERDEMQFDRLGIAFRGFMDFGGNLMEPRGAVKNTM